MKFQFPEDFYWGAATASYQVEGYNENTDWAKAAKAGRVPPAGRLADHYHRFEEDFDIAKELGHTAHRFSVEWARLEPREGVWDKEEFEHYKNVLRALRARNLEPFITCWHFTLPQWVADKGGFKNREVVDLFARYCKKVAKELGEDCQHFSTMNEPNVYATHGYLYGAWPPFKRLRIGWKKIGKEDGTSDRARPKARFYHVFQYFRVANNLTQAHMAAYTAMKKVRPKSDISIVKHVHYFEANQKLRHKIYARIMAYFQTLKFLNKINNHLDSIGLNYYRHTKFGDRKNYLITDMGWKIYPSGIYGALLLLKKYQKPIFISEAGIADQDDDIRGDYIEVQVKAVAKAMQAGVDVQGHMYWSLMDNYEWALGTQKRFGLVEINYQTLERKIRPSALEYKNIIEANEIEL